MTNLQQIPCWYYASKIMFVDDNKEFLSSLLPHFIDKINLITETSASKAINMLQKLDYNSLRCYKHKKDIESMLPEEDNLVNLDISEIHKNIYSKDRFDLLSVMVVDYSMPQMTGLDVCRDLSYLPIKKMILTGVADHNLAIQAFNDKLIDKFVVKDSDCLAETIYNAVSDLQYQFFCDQSYPVYKGIINSGEKIITLPDYISLFLAVRDSQNFIEYYLLDVNGSYLFFDSMANPTWLIVRNDADIQEYLDMAVGNDADVEIIKSLQDRSKLPFFFTAIDKEVPISEWNKYLFPAQRLSDTDIYYSIVTEKTCNTIQWEQIESFHNYQQK